MSRRNRTGTPSPSPLAPSDAASYSKGALARLADGLRQQEQAAIDQCVDFVVLETRGVWHGRGRAMMCRRLKHCALDQFQQRQLVDCITLRLMSGEFSEQFKDQLRLALHIDSERTREAARQASASSLAYVARYAQWVLLHFESDPVAPPNE